MDYEFTFLNLCSKVYLDGKKNEQLDQSYSRLVLNPRLSPPNMCCLRLC
jgi:hypothetical protein